MSVGSEPVFGGILVLWQQNRASLVVWMLLSGKPASEGQCHFCFMLCKPEPGTVSGAESGTYFLSLGFLLFLLPFPTLPSFRLRLKSPSLESPLAFCGFPPFSSGPADHTTSLPHDISPGYTSPVYHNWVKAFFDKHLSNISKAF